MLSFERFFFGLCDYFGRLLGVPISFLNASQEETIDGKGFLAKELPMCQL